MNHVLRASVAIASCILLTVWSVTPASGAEAQASTPAAAAPPAPPSDFGLAISPTRLVVGQADIGTTQQVKVRNGGRSTMAVTVKKENFSAHPDGTLAYQDSAPYSASSWVTVNPMSFQLAPGATQIVTAAISVPDRPEPGDHHVALVFLVPAGATEANVKINRGIAIPAYIAVPGPIDESASISNLGANGFAIGGPVKITADVRGDGTVHRDFRGTTPLRVSTSGTAAAFPDFTVMRGATREISTTWNPPLACICHPSVSFVNADGTVQTTTLRVIVLPLPLMGAVAGGLLMLVATVRFLRRRYRASVITAAARLGRPVSSDGA